VTNLDTVCLQCTRCLAIRGRGVLGLCSAGDRRQSRWTLLAVGGAHMCAKGLISYYHGVPEIIVRSSGQILP
jgi:hypothetical protein